MAQIRPFRAFRYNLEQVSLQQVVTQPYDKITPAMQDRYYQASPYNLVRIILGRREENDNPAKSVYSRAASDFHAWRTNRALIQDSEESIYVYSQKFTLPGSTALAERRGFIALGRIEDYSAGVVFRHEQTLAKPKADRLDLLRATRAHFGQIFMLYEDSGQVQDLLDVKDNADVSLTDEYGVVHSLWQVTNAEIIRSVQEEMTDKKLIIADGHHRYETALNYRDERRSAAGTGDPDAPYESVMMTFINMKSSGLVILPTHRVIHSLPALSDDEFRTDARRFFDVDEIEPSLDAKRATVMLRECGRSGTAILAVTARRAFLLHHPNPSAQPLLAGLSLSQQALDVVQLHKCLLENVLGLSEESIRNQQNISYFRDADDALAQVRGGTADVAFLINPCRVSEVRDIAFAGQVMPQKSTDFYPKLLSGLTIYALE
ncbi:MAG TPA: DUF1015 domain-containing protein [Candidatus Binatia bacterium]|nr:DUF1015 domain-containing protein [Candidatus Binatia bacterium]